MPSGQTSYVQVLVQALQGMLDRPLNGVQEVDSKTVAAASSGIAEGLGVTRVADDTVTLPAAAGDVTAHFQGVVARLTAREPRSGAVVADGGVLMYGAKDQVPIVRTGVVWVPVEAAVAQDDPVYCRHTVNGGLNVIGGFANAAGTGLALVAGAKFIDTVSAAGLARVKLLGV
jgi:hypothetical protein